MTCMSTGPFLQLSVYTEIRKVELFSSGKQKVIHMQLNALYLEFAVSLDIQCFCFNCFCQFGEEGGGGGGA